MTDFNLSIMPTMNQSGFEKQHTVKITPAQIISRYGDDPLHIPWCAHFQQSCSQMYESPGTDTMSISSISTVLQERFTDDRS